MKHGSMIMILKQSSRAVSGVEIGDVPPKKVRKNLVYQEKNVCDFFNTTGVKASAFNRKSYIDL